MYTHIFARTPHTCISIVTTENVSQENPTRPQKKTTKETSIGLSTMEKFRTFSSSLVIDGVVHVVIILLLLCLYPLFFRGLFFLGSPGISVAKRTLKYKDAKGKRRKKTQKDWKSYKDTLKHNHLDFVTAFLLYFSKHFLSSLTWCFEHHLHIWVVATQVFYKNLHPPKLGEDEPISGGLVQPPTKRQVGGPQRYHAKSLKEMGWDWIPWVGSVCRGVL